MKHIKRFLREEDGPTAVEYAVMLAMIIMFCIGAVEIFGRNTAQNFNDSVNAIDSAINGS